MASRFVSSDPEFLLNMLDEIDCDASDDDFDGYMEEEELSIRETEEGEHAMRQRLDNDESDEVNIENEDNEACGSSVQMNTEIDENEQSASSIPSFDSSVSGVTEDMTHSEPVDFFQKYIDDTISHHILSETNLYGDQYIESHQQFLEDHP